MTSVLIGLIIMTMARDLGSRVLAGERAGLTPRPTGLSFDQTA